MMPLISPRMDSTDYIAPASFNLRAIEPLSQTPERRKISLPWALKKRGSGSIESGIPGDPLVLEDIDDQDLRFPGKF